MEPLNDETRNLPKFKWAASNIGQRHQLDGEPNFIREDDWPQCIEYPIKPLHIIILSY